MKTMETTNKTQNLSKYELPELGQKGLFRRCFYKPTQSPVGKKEYFYAADDFTALSSALAHGRFDQMQKLHRQSDGNVKLVVLRSKDGKFAAAQVFRYQPFDFVPESEIVVIKEGEIAAFNEALGK